VDCVSSWGICIPERRVVYVASVERVAVLVGAFAFHNGALYTWRVFSELDFGARKDLVRE